VVSKEREGVGEACGVLEGWVWCGAIGGEGRRGVIELEGFPRTTVAGRAFCKSGEGDAWRKMTLSASPLATLSR